MIRRISTWPNSPTQTTSTWRSSNWWTRVAKFTRTCPHERSNPGSSQPCRRHGAPGRFPKCDPQGHVSDSRESAQSLVPSIGGCPMSMSTGTTVRLDIVSSETSVGLPLTTPSWCCRTPTPLRFREGMWKSYSTSFSMFQREPTIQQRSERLM